VEFGNYLKKVSGLDICSFCYGEYQCPYVYFDTNNKIVHVEMYRQIYCGGHVVLWWQIDNKSRL